MGGGGGSWLSKSDEDNGEILCSLRCFPLLSEPITNQTKTKSWLTDLIVQIGYRSEGELGNFDRSLERVEENLEETICSLRRITVFCIHVA